MIMMLVIFKGEENYMCEKVNIFCLIIKDNHCWHVIILESYFLFLRHILDVFYSI